MGELEIRDALDAGKTVTVDGETLPVLAQTDVLVAGGGPAGSMAAIASGRRGAATILVEAQPFLGGIATGGPIHSYYWGLSGGLQDELDRRNAELDPQLAASVRGWHPEGRKIALDTMAERAGVNLWLRTSVTGAILEGDTVRGVIVDGACGRGVILAETIVDATGDGDVATLAGARWRMGREGDGIPMAYSLTPGTSRERDGAQVAYANFDAGWTYPTDPIDYARAFTIARRYLWRDPYDEEKRSLFSGAILGVRESRTIVGEYTLTLDDLFFGKCFPDTIGKTRSHYDNHARDYALESTQARIFCDVAGNWKTALECDVPYRALVPANLDGLLVAGRCISMTHDAAQAVRMIKDMHRIGEAAGIAAAISARDDVSTREVGVAELQRELVKTGILTDAEIAAGRREERRQPRLIPELIEALGEEGRETAIWELYRVGEAAHDALIEALASDEERARYAALVLGAQGVEEARPLLVRMVEERDDTVPSNHPYVQPRWVGALACLTMEPRVEERDLYAAALEAEAPFAEPWLYALEGIEALSDPEAAGAVRCLLERIRADERYWSETYDPKEHPGWKLEIAAAKALRAMGDPEGEEILRRYVDDRRLTVSRYARSLLEEASEE